MAILRPVLACALLSASLLWLPRMAQLPDLGWWVLNTPRCALGGLVCINVWQDHIDITVEMSW